MALSKTVIDSLEEAQQSLRNALAFSARNERTLVNLQIAQALDSISNIIKVDNAIDKIENLNSKLDNDGKNFFGNFFDIN